METKNTYRKIKALKKQAYKESRTGSKLERMSGQANYETVCKWETTWLYGSDEAREEVEKIIARMN